VFIGYADNDIALKAGDDAAKAQWFALDKLPPLAFDHGDVMEILKLKSDSTSL
jgi:8-oxo-dGTP diphosphatase